jgi:hypothetical protein
VPKDAPASEPPIDHKIIIMAPATRARLGSNLPKNPVTLTTDRLTRCSLLPLSPSPLDEDYKDATDYSVNDKEETTAFLKSCLICILNCLMDMQNIIASLHHINQFPNMSMIAREVIRAVAFILEDHTASEIANSITSHIMTPITEQVTAHVIKAMQPHVGELLHTSKALTHSASTLQIHHASLTTTIDSLNNQADNITQIHTNIEEKLACSIEFLTPTLEEIKDSINTSAPVNNIQTSIDKIIPAIEASQAHVKELIENNRSVNNEPHQTDNPRPTYSSITKLGSPPTLINANTPIQATPAIARAAVCDRQILIQPTGTDPLFDPTFTPEEIALRLEAAVDALDNPNDITIEVKAVLRLHTGCLLLELNSKEATDWIRTEAIHVQLIEYLNIQGAIKDRQYPILVPFLPIKHDLASKEWIDLIERENKLPQGSITSIKWVKPIEKRSREQRVAHAVFIFNDPSTANTLLRDSIIIAKMKLHPWKEKRDPI